MSTLIMRAGSITRGSYEVFNRLGEGYNVTIMSFLGENTWNNISHIIPYGKPSGDVLHVLLLCLLAELGHVVLHLVLLLSSPSEVSDS